MNSIKWRPLRNPVLDSDDSETDQPRFGEKRYVGGAYHPDTILMTDMPPCVNCQAPVERRSKQKWQQCVDCKEPCGPFCPKCHWNLEFDNESPWWQIWVCSKCENDDGSIASGSTSPGFHWDPDASGYGIIREEQLAQIDADRLKPRLTYREVYRINPLAQEENRMLWPPTLGSSDWERHLDELIPQTDAKKEIGIGVIEEIWERFAASLLRFGEILEKWERMAEKILLSMNGWPQEDCHFSKCL